MSSRAVSMMMWRSRVAHASLYSSRLPRHTAQLQQRRWASSSSPSPSSQSGGSSSHASGGQRGQHHFRAGVVDPTPYQVKPNYSIPMWQPPARFMKYPAVRWLSNNLLALAAYQFALEASFTVVFGSLLYAETITAQGVVDGLERLHYPFMSWLDVEGCVYSDPVHVGPFTLNPQKMTALHTGHNIANGLLPLQVVLMLSTFSPVHRLYCRLRGVSVASAAASASTPAAASAASSAGAKAGGAEAAGRGGHPRRASYARPSSSPSTPRKPF